MVGGDALGDVGQVELDGGLDGGVLVLGVALEQGDDAADVGGDVGPGDGVGGVDPAGRRGDGEQLGADALVDVLVEVEGDEVEGVGGGQGSVIVMSRIVREPARRRS